MKNMGNFAGFFPASLNGVQTVFTRRLVYVPFAVTQFANERWIAAEIDE